jgi:predicted  nucleic acid-binding Zn-ribbon protein
MEKKMDLNLETMASAHLQTVQKAIADLEQQSQNIFQEIKKLQEYLEKGQEVISSQKNEK